MDSVLKLIHLTIFLIGFTSAEVFPVEKCKLSDSSCMTPAFQTAAPIFFEGMPDLEIEVQDPLEMEDLAFEISGLKFSLKEGRLKGLKGMLINKVTWDENKKRFDVNLNVNCSIKGHYTAAGRLLILPISGDGLLRLKLRNVQIDMFIDFKMVTTDDGKQHVKPIKYDLTFDVIDNAYFNLTGLFNGNQGLSDTMLTFMNENWKPISVEFGRPIINSAAKTLFKNIAQFFSKVPIEDVADVS